MRAWELPHNVQVRRSARTPSRRSLTLAQSHPRIRPRTGKASGTAANFTYAQVAYHTNPDYPNHTKEADGTYPIPYLMSTYDIRSCIKAERKEIMADTKERLVVRGVGVGERVEKLRRVLAPAPTLATSTLPAQCTTTLMYIRCHPTRQTLGVKHMNTIAGKKVKKGKISAQPHPSSDEPSELNAPIGMVPQAGPPGHTMQAVPLPPGAEPPAEPEKGRVKVKFTAASGKVVREEPQMKVRVRPNFMDLFIFAFEPP